MQISFGEFIVCMMKQANCENRVGSYAHCILIFLLLRRWCTRLVICSKVFLQIFSGEWNVNCEPIYIKPIGEYCECELELVPLLGSLLTVFTVWNMVWGLCCILLFFAVNMNSYCEIVIIAMHLWTRYLISYPAYGQW